MLDLDAVWRELLLLVMDVQARAESLCAHVLTLDSQRLTIFPNPNCRAQNIPTLPAFQRARLFAKGEP
jgi:hypothetical protein